MRKLQQITISEEYQQFKVTETSQNDIRYSPSDLEMYNPYNKGFVTATNFNGPHFMILQLKQTTELKQIQVECHQQLTPCEILIYGSLDNVAYQYLMKIRCSTSEAEQMTQSTQMGNEILKNKFLYIKVELKGTLRNTKQVCITNIVIKGTKAMGEQDSRQIEQNDKPTNIGDVKQSSMQHATNKLFNSFNNTHSPKSSDTGNKQQKPTSTQKLEQPNKQNKTQNIRFYYIDRYFKSKQLERKQQQRMCLKVTKNKVQSNNNVDKNIFCKQQILNRKYIAQVDMKDQISFNHK